MKKMNQLLLAALLGSLAVLCLVNWILFHVEFSGDSRAYRISLNRAEHALRAFEQEKGRVPENLEELNGFAGKETCPEVTKLQVLKHGIKAEDFQGNEETPYIVTVTEYACYKVYYCFGNPARGPVVLLVNGAAGCFLLLAWAVLLYVRQKILLPFFRLSGLPYQLSKGNLTIPLKENKNRFFGKFMWGMDVLRENLEEHKKRELELQKEKKLLLLSLSHDIKTPLSAIHLYAQALCRNLYQEESKKQEIARNIREKAEEIESYVGEIVKASNEDFLDFQVESREFYIREALGQIRSYYQEKMALNQVEFIWGSCPDCLVRGDLDRLVEVVQNVVENAIKYGDGRKIEISASREEEEYAVLIRNTGCELSGKDLPHVFDSFFRGSNVGKNPGSGLGLYICRQLMHLMEGEITAGIRDSDGEVWMEVYIVLQLA
ncbi:HAMP domain-containing sensor histidine kinase [Lachnospiraceae bacterium KK002]